MLMTIEHLGTRIWALQNGHGSFCDTATKDAIVERVLSMCLYNYGTKQTILLTRLVRALLATTSIVPEDNIEKLFLTLSFNIVVPSGI